MKRNNNGTFSLDDDEIECLQRALDAEYPSVPDPRDARIRELERTLLSTQIQNEDRLRCIRELDQMFSNLQAEAKTLLESLNKAASARDRVTAENKRLRGAIERAPHDGGCPLDGLRAESRWNPNSEEPCDCWKSKALEAERDALREESLGRNQDCHRLADENKRLREALLSITLRCEEGDKRSDWIPTILSIARKALKGES